MHVSPQNEYILKNLDLEHVPAVVALEEKCFSKPWRQEQCRAVFTQKHFFGLGLWKNIDNYKVVTPEQVLHQEYLASYISFYHVLDEMEILNIAVDPQFRQKGLGTYILGKSLEKAREKNIQKVFLEVRVGNAIARNLYEKFSFMEVGKRAKYYADTGEDACIYALDL